MTEYDELLTEVKAKAEAFRSSAKEYIPKMYSALRNENQNISPSDARDRIEKDCVGFWSRRTIIDALPDEAKDSKKQESGRLGGKKHKSAALSAAPNKLDKRRQIMVDTSGSSSQSQEPSCYERSDKEEPQLDIASQNNRAESKDESQSQRDHPSSQLEKEVQQLKQQIISLQEQHSLDANKIKELETESTKNHSMRPNQISRTQSEPPLSAPDMKKQNQIEFEFSMSLENLRYDLAQIFNETKGTGKVPFHGTIDVQTGKVTSILIGRRRTNEITN